MRKLAALVRGQQLLTHIPCRKDMKKNMQKFLETGVHPDVEQQRKRAAESSSSNVPLPLHDPNR